MIPSLGIVVVYNVLNFPVGCVPVSFFNDQDVKDMVHYPKFDDGLHYVMHNICKDAAGLPLNVQVIGRPWQEELILHAMKEVDLAMDFRNKFNEKLAIHK